MLLRSNIKHIEDQNWLSFGTRRILLFLTLTIALLCVACTAPEMGRESTNPYITSATPLRIVSVNDGDALASVWGGERKFPDSVTVIDLMPDAPPVTRTVQDAAPNTFAGAPYGAVISAGRYAFIANHPFGASVGAKDEPNQVAVVDLDADDLSIIQTFDLPYHAWQVMAHPDDRRVIAISDRQFHLFSMDDGEPTLISESDPFPRHFTSFAVSPDGRAIIATAAERLDYTTPVALHLFTLTENTITHVSEIGIAPDIGEIDQPFAPRFSPDGKRVLVLNGLGIVAKQPLDAVLSIDMTATPPEVTDAIPDLAQGLESVAFHPSGRFAVITCLDGPYIGHLAVIDLTSKSMRVLSYLPVDFSPQGVEFSPDGSMLFVQSTTAGHISVYEIDGFALIKSSYVLRTGAGPGSMALVKRGAK
jgi:WD40 repeat protein